jgi:hypothetical protein
VREQIEQKLADYRQGLEYLQAKHQEAVKAVQTLEAAMLRQQGAIEGLEALLGTGGDDGDERPYINGSGAGVPRQDD